MNKVSKRNEEEWKSIIKDFINSGESKKAYCQSRNVKYYSLKNWYYKLRDELSKNNYSHLVYDPSDFIQLKVKESKNVPEQEELLKDNQALLLQSAKTTEIKITLRNGIRVEAVTDNIVNFIKELNYVAS